MRFIDSGLKTGQAYDHTSYARAMAEVRAKREAKKLGFFARLLAWWKAL